MKKILLSTLILGLLYLPANAFYHAKADTIRMGTEAAYPPYNFINDNGEIDGFERDLGDELCERAGLDCEWVQNDWDSIIPNLVSGNYDTIIAGMSITEERDEVIDFTQDYFPPDPSAYVTTGDGNKAAYIGVVGAQTATIQASHVAESGAILVEFATADETIAALRNGEVEAVLADKAFLAPIVNESNGDIKFIASDVYIGGGIGIGIRESDSDLRETFNAAIDSMKEDGSLNDLIKKWFGEDATVY